MRRSTFFFRRPVVNDLAQSAKLQEIDRSGVEDLRHDPNLIYEHSINPAYGIVDAYEHLAPVIDTDAAMSWLMTTVQGKGAHFITDTLCGDLFTQEDEIRAKLHVEIIVNATGLGSTELAGDTTCYPLRGALIRVINDGKRFDKVSEALTVPADAGSGLKDFVFIVPRNDNILLLGGFAQQNEHVLDLTLDSPAVKKIRERCEALLPKLRNALVDPEYPLAQGLRPFRQRNVRVEREPRRHRSRCHPFTTRPSRIIHSYGQGGAGWSLSFGCAEEVASMTADALMDATEILQARL
jgi:glycine/D-amino acid oxidase-like deaminating enzyme